LETRLTERDTNVKLGLTKIGNQAKTTDVFRKKKLYFLPI